MKLWKKFKGNHYAIIIALILFVFFISANIAWLNPLPSHVVKTHKKYPIMWQYSPDATMEFLSAAFFPEYYRIDKSRTNRPGYPFLVKVIGEGISLPLKPFITVPPLAKGIIGYVLLKLMVYIVGAILMYRIILHWFKPSVALLSVALAFFHPWIIYWFGQFHTTELSFITPIITLFLFLNLCKNYSIKKNIYYSLLFGFLMLAKQNYAIYFTIIIFSIFILRRYKEAILSFGIHLLPLGAWLGFLKLINIPYYNRELEMYNQGVWLFNDLLFRPFLEIIQQTFYYTWQWLNMGIAHFSFFIILAIAVFSIKKLRNKIDKKLAIFIAIFIFMNWAQFFAARRIWAYMTSDLSIIIYPLAAYAVYYLLKRYKLEKFTIHVVVIYLFISLISLITFPWVHPYNQEDKLDSKPDRVNLFKEGKLVPKPADQIPDYLK